MEITIGLVVQLLVIPFGGLLWAQLKEAKAKAEQNQKELADYRVEVAEKYAKKDDLRMATEDMAKVFEQAMSQVLVRLSRIESLLDAGRNKE